MHVIGPMWALAQSPGQRLDALPHSAYRAAAPLRRRPLADSCAPPACEPRTTCVVHRSRSTTATVSSSCGVALPPYFPSVPPKTERPYPRQPGKQGRALRARTHPFPFGAAASVRDLVRLADWCEVRSGRNTQEKRRHKQNATPHAEDRDSVKRAHILESGQLWRKHYGKTRRSARPLR